jgi:Uma2 family endonuclease
MGAALHTYEDLLAIPDDGLRRELFDGVLVVTPLPVLRHQVVLTNLMAVVGPWCEARGWLVVWGVGLLFDPVNYLVPDLVIARPDHPVDLVNGRYFEHAPALVVEVASPSTRRRDLGAKRDRYESWGVPEYWFIDHESARLVRHRLANGRYVVELLRSGQTLTAPTLPELHVDVDQILRDRQ